MMHWPEIDFAFLKKVNPRTVGWIRLQGTLIDYPVVQAPDDRFYLTHNFSDEPSVHGCIFAYGNTSFPGSRCVLYGHAMQDGTMFVTLHRYYYDDGFFEAHRTIDLKTEDADYVLRVWGAILLPEDYVFMTRLPETREYFEEWKKAIQALSTFEPGFELNFEDRIMALCTCRMISVIGEKGTLMVVGKAERSEE